MAVEGKFILDLSLSPPPPSPGIASDTDRKNLTLHTESGPITAEIWVRPDDRMNSKRVSLDLFSGNGFVRAIIVRFSRSWCHFLMRCELLSFCSTTFSFPTEAAAHFHSWISSCALTLEIYMSRFPVAFAGQLPSVPSTIGLPFLLHSKNVRP